MGSAWSSAIWSFFPFPSLPPGLTHGSPQALANTAWNLMPANASRLGWSARLRAVEGGVSNRTFHTEHAELHPLGGDGACLDRIW